MSLLDLLLSFHYEFSVIIAFGFFPRVLRETGRIQRMEIGKTHEEATRKQECD